jgi:hypothetical protein
MLLEIGQETGMTYSDVGSFIEGMFISCVVIVVWVLLNHLVVRSRRDRIILSVFLFMAALILVFF